MNYQKCVELWNGRRNATHRKLDRNTYLEFDGADFTITLHGHPILRHEQDGKVVYDSCGWQTLTTRDRMNHHGADGWYVSQKDRIWYLHRGWDTPFYPFADGITVLPDGSLDGVGVDPKATQKLQKQVVAYAKKYVEALATGNVKEPGPGDCFYCRGMFGDEPNSDHILSHIEEQYYVPSLLVNAIRSGHTSIAAEQSAYGYLYNKPEHVYRVGFIDKQIQDVLVKYIRHQLNLA